MMMWASDLPSGLPADVLAQLLAGRLALVPAKIRYALPRCGFLRYRFEP